MPYRRSYRKKNNFRKKSRKLNPRQKTQVKRLIGRKIESKHWDQNSLANSVASVGSVVGPFLQCPQGIAETSRIGDIVLLQKISVALSVTLADTTNIVRIIFFRWHQNDASVSPAVNAVWPSLAAGPLAQLNETNIENGVMSILWDRTYNMSNSGEQVITRKFTLYGKRLGKKRVTFNPALTTGTGQIYAAFVSDSIALPNPTVSVSARIIYSDA